MNCRGQEVPPQTYTNAFCDLIEKLESELDPNEVVGVHCTHGLNRTGYLLIEFLCQRKKLSLEEAFSLFEGNRPPHKFTKEVLIEDLYKKFYGQGYFPVYEKHIACLQDYNIDMNYAIERQQVMNKSAKHPSRNLAEPAN